MGILFKADEIFEMAEQIERNGAKFYRKAAAGAKDEKARDFLLNLAAQEDEHESTFNSLRKEILGDEAFQAQLEKDEQFIPFLKSWVDGYVFDMRADPTAKIKGDEPLDDIIRIAISLEKDSILFYLGLKEHTPVRHGKEKIDSIIREEMKHISTLNAALPKRA